MSGSIYSILEEIGVLDVSHIGKYTSVFLLEIP